MRFSSTVVWANQMSFKMKVQFLREKKAARGRAVLAGRLSLRMRHFLLLLYASVESRDWGEGCTESSA
jgi:hypothetical protein